jgi:hypothetical protein
MRIVLISALALCACTATASAQALNDVVPRAASARISPAPAGKVAARGKWTNVSSLERTMREAILRSTCGTSPPFRRPRLLPMPVITTSSRRGNLCHRDHPACCVEATFDPRLTDLDTALPIIVYAHLDRSREDPAAFPPQGACTDRVHMHGAKTLRRRHDPLTADVNHSIWCTRYRFKWRGRS